MEKGNKGGRLFSFFLIIHLKKPVEWISLNINATKESNCPRRAWNERARPLMTKLNSHSIMQFIQICHLTIFKNLQCNPGVKLQYKTESLLFDKDPPPFLSMTAIVCHVLLIKPSHISIFYLCLFLKYMLSIGYQIEQPFTPSVIFPFYIPLQNLYFCCLIPWYFWSWFVL